MERDLFDVWNLIFNGIGATITLATALIAVWGFVTARRSKRAAAEAKRRADAAQAAADEANTTAERAKRNEARTYQSLKRALQVVGRKPPLDAEPLMDFEKELLESSETEEERAERMQAIQADFVRRTEQYGSSKWIDDILQESDSRAEQPDTIEKILADMEREEDDR